MIGGAGADDSLPRQIACRNGGSWAAINDGDDPLTKMASFFTFLSTSVTEGVVYWTEPYEDFSTGDAIGVVGGAECMLRAECKERRRAARQRRALSHSWRPSLVGAARRGARCWLTGGAGVDAQGAC